jgi:hypothetical protein
MLVRVLPLAVLVAAGLFLWQAAALPRGTAAKPGAGFYPFFVAVFACAVALVATVQAFLGRSPALAQGPALEPDARRRVLASIAALAAFCLVLPWIGYPGAAFLFVTFVLSQLGSRWTSALAIGVASAAITHYLFAVLLDVPLPRGPW